ncbi:MAG: MFS transporter [Rhizobiales bacterium]|nr:MFS transporter [Hyphomicrobiales bacterium]
MSKPALSFGHLWLQIAPRYLPFADVASRELPLLRILRLSLFQVSVGISIVLLNGTLNRVMIVELNVPAWLIATLIGLPLVLAPFRALIGFRSDHHRSFLGWRRVPYIWFGTLLQFGGLAIMPFALIVLSGDMNGPVWVAHAAAGLAFLLVGAGIHTTQTAGLALATDLAPSGRRPRIVALLYVMLLLGMFFGSLSYGALLADFSQIRLIQVIQGTAALVMVVNVVALWKQEPRSPAARLPGTDIPRFAAAWSKLRCKARVVRLLTALALGTAAFSMQDILLEPYGAEVFGLSVSATTLLTALLAGGMLAGFAWAARALGRGLDPYRMSAFGALIGVAAFSLVILAGPMDSTVLFGTGVALVGIGGGLFSVGMLSGAMSLADHDDCGLVIGTWGAVQATAAGLAIAIGALLRDVTSGIAEAGQLGPAFAGPAIGYSVVYHFEIALLFATLVVIGPVVGPTRAGLRERPIAVGLSDLPG